MLATRRGRERGGRRERGGGKEREREGGKEGMEIKGRGSCGFLLLRIIFIDLMINRPKYYAVSIYCVREALTPTLISS